MDGRAVGTEGSSRARGDADGATVAAAAAVTAVDDRPLVLKNGAF